MALVKLVRGYTPIMEYSDIVLSILEDGSDLKVVKTISGNPGRSQSGKA